MITLFHAPRSRSSSIVWLLEELGEPYAIVPVHIGRGEQFEERFQLSAAGRP